MRPPAPQVSNFIDNRPQLQPPAPLQAKMRNSPRAMAWESLRASMTDRPREDTQRQPIGRRLGQPVQRQQVLEEEDLQMQAAPGPLQRQEREDEELVQGRFASSEPTTQRQGAEQAGVNRTGMPGPLRTGLEQLSGHDLSVVRVHYNSPKPAQLNALAYTQGRDIEVGPGQERHLPHEGWHVVQQMQGRVKPTLQAQGVAINDDVGLEHEADVMGAKAMQMRRSEKSAFEFPIHMRAEPGTLQRQDLEDEELVNGKIETVQRQKDQNELELLQGRFDPDQRQVSEDEATAVDTASTDLSIAVDQSASATQLAAMQTMAEGRPILQRFRRVGGANYHDYNELPGCNYRILREFRTQNYRIHDIGAGVVLARVWTQAEAAQLALFFGNFHAARAGNLDDVMAALLAHLAGGGNVAVYFVPIRVVNRAACLQVAVLPNTSFTFWQRIGGAQRYLFNAGHNSDLGVVLTAAHVVAIQLVFALLQARGVANLDEIVVALDKASSLGIPVDVTIARLNAIEQNLLNFVLVRIQTDHAAIDAMVGGMLGPAFAAVYRSIEIPGSDPHKGGQVVVFINYQTLGGNELRVVYKPSDLTMDALLYRSAVSVAHELGTALSDYAMLPMVDMAAAAPLQHYGYMEFVQSGGPTTAPETRSVFRSLGANLALAYVFGLRDIHQENFILLNDAIQFIDMEAATGTFTGFNTMELNALPAELYRRIGLGFAAAGLSWATVRGWMPDTGNLQAEMFLGFASKLSELDPAYPVHGAPVTGHVTAAANAQARFVPFLTADLQTLVARFQGSVPAGLAAGPMLAAWHAETQRIANDATVAAGNPAGLSVQMLVLLRAPATQAAVHAGDVPFWSRVGSTVFGEDGVQIVAALNHPRLDTTANNLANANARRAPGNAANASALFVAQVFPLMDDPTTAILTRLKNERINAGHGPPNY